MLIIWIFKDIWRQFSEFGEFLLEHTIKSYLHLTRYPCPVTSNYRQSLQSVWIFLLEVSKPNHPLFHFLAEHSNFHQKHWLKRFFLCVGQQDGAVEQRQVWFHPCRDVEYGLNEINFWTESYQVDKHCSSHREDIGSTKIYIYSLIHRTFDPNLSPRWWTWLSILYFFDEILVFGRYLTILSRFGFFFIWFVA